MATILGLNSCETGRANTGIVKCFKDFKRIIGLFLVSDDFYIPNAELGNSDDAIEFLRAAARADSAGQRIYPVFNLDNPTNNSDTPTVQTFSDGREVTVREGLFKWGWQIVEGGWDLHKSLRKFNSNGAWNALFVDADFTLIGSEKTDGLYGFDLTKNWANVMALAGGDAVTNYPFEVQFPQYLEDTLNYANLDGRLRDVKGLRDITLISNAWNATTGVANVTVLTGGYNLAADFAATLVQTAAWKAYNFTTGGVITITGVTLVDDGKNFSVNLSEVDADYPTVTGDKLVLTLVAPSVLAGLTPPIIGFEANKLTYLIP